MKYYLIRQPSDKKVVGINDGGVQAEIIESRWKDKENLKRYIDQYVLGIESTLKKVDNGIDVQPPILEYIKVKPKAILTDFLTFSEAYAGGRYLISDNAKQILKEYNVNCKLYTDIGLYHLEKRVKGYSNLHIFPLKAESSFDFKKSIFFTGLKLAGKTFRYAETYEEYVALQKEGRMLNIELLSLKRSEVEELDLFTFDKHPKIYVSERLRQAFENAGVTGITFHEPEEPKLQIL